MRFELVTFKKKNHSNYDDQGEGQTKRQVDKIERERERERERESEREKMHLFMKFMLKCNFQGLFFA